MKDWNPSAAERAARYAKARVTCKAPRGWEPWAKWEDGMVVGLVEHGALTVGEIAKATERTENAILCRIEKRYGADTRELFTAKWSWDIFPPDLDYPNPFQMRPLRSQFNQFMEYYTVPFSERYMHHSDDAMRDAEIFSAALRDIQQMLHPIAFTQRPLDPKRWAYRVSPAEYRAIGREIQRRQFSLNITGEAKMSRSGNYFASITLCGVRLTRSFDSPPAPVIKDYGVSG